MRQLARQLRQLPKQDKWLLITVILILMAIIAAVLYGWRASELHDERERAYKLEVEAKSEQNRLEIERNAAQAAAEIEKLKRLAADVAFRQTETELRDVRVELATLDRARREELREYDAKLKGIISSRLSACERWIKNCATAKRLGLRDPDAPCECR